jgi:isocitrate dehydrogenase
MAKTITLIPGDGIGVEVANATRRILEAAGAKLNYEVCEAGAAAFAKGVATGVPAETLDSIARNRVVLKGPLETPVGYGGKSANVTLRKLFEAYGNIRPVKEMPGIASPYQGRNIDLVIVRENVEDLYAGIEHMQTPDVAQCLKLISHKGCEKIARLAFEVARAEGRKLVHCSTKANIMKLTEGMMKRVFEEVARDYPEIEAQHIIIDNCAHRLVMSPERFEVIVTTNMNGDIISDLAAGLVGGLGLAPSANIGRGIAMFEAVHGSAPDIAGKGLANPTALLLAAVMMLRHLSEFDIANTVEQALYATLAEGKVRTGDIAPAGMTPASTDALRDAVIGNLGKSHLLKNQRPHRALKLPENDAPMVHTEPSVRRVGGIDLFIESSLDALTLGRSLDSLVEGTPFRLKILSNRGTSLYPKSEATTDLVDHWRCRFVLRDGGIEAKDDLIGFLVARIGSTHRWMHAEKLQLFDGKPAYSLDQGETP